MLASAAFSFSFFSFGSAEFWGFGRACAEVSLVDEQDSFYWYQEAKYLATKRKDYGKALQYCEKSLKLNPDNMHARELKEWLTYRLDQLAEIKRQKELRAKQQAGGAEPEGTKEAEVSAGAGTPASESTEEALLNNLNYYQGLTKLTEGKFDEANDFFKNDIIDNPGRLESWFYIFKYEKDNGNESGALFYLKKLREKINEAGAADAELLSTIKRQCALYQDEAILQKGLYKHNLDMDIKNEIKGNYDWKAVSTISATSDILLEGKILASLDIPKLKQSGSIPKNFATPASNFSIDLNGRVVASKQSFRKKPKIEIPVLTQKAAEKIRDDIENLIAQGDYYAYIGIYDRALAFYNEALARAPESPVANNNKGVMLKAAGRFDEAVKCFKNAISFDKSYVEAYNNLATIYSERGNEAEALKLFLAASKLNPLEAGVHYNIGVLYHKSGDFERAREYINRAIELNAADPSYYYQLGLIDIKKNNRKSAYQNFQKVSRMVPRDSEVYSKVRELMRTLTND
ncbi:MAG TPA: tetratricopeptide repeat protein [Candidatus Wallbacteria bacterium]|nr:tetratricopeptide repeat protein [Candidatus Wallbacteria bacterium]